MKELFSKQYDRKNYNCFHFANDAWLELKGKRICNLSRLEEVFSTIHRNFKRVDIPSNHALVTMRERTLGDFHIGVIVNDKVLHLNSDGVQYCGIDMLNVYYKDFRFYDEKQIIRKSKSPRPRLHKSL